MTTVIESGIQLLARLTDNSKKSLEGLEEKLFPGGLQIKQTVEITGDPGSGKTLLLTQLIATCILPTEYKGFNMNVLLINTDHHFQVAKLAQILRNNIEKSSTESESPDKSKLKELIEISLKNLLIINCTSNYQFICNLYSLPDILSSNNKIGIVALDGISAFYWQDREMSGANMFLNSYVSNVLHQIQESTFLNNVKTIFTKHSEFITQGQSVSECVAQPGLKKVNHRINLSKEMDSTRGVCEVESIKGSTSFGYETTEVGLKWL